MTPRLWQRQPEESPADFIAFAAYLRLKGRRSHRATAEATGRPLGAIRRLSAKNNWIGRVAAFEARLAHTTQEALDSVIYGAATRSRSDLEQFRIKEFLFAHRVIEASDRWLKQASDFRRHRITLHQLCRVTELAFKLKCFACGLPFGDEPRRRPRREDSPGYWTAPSFEESLKRIYGSRATDQSPPATATAAPLAATPAPPPPAAPAPVAPVVAENPATQSPDPGSDPTAPAPDPVATPDPEPPPSPRRNDAWSRLHRQLYPRK